MYCFFNEEHLFQDLYVCHTSLSLYKGARHLKVFFPFLNPLYTPLCQDKVCCFQCRFVLHLQKFITSNTMWLYSLTLITMCVASRNATDSPRFQPSIHSLFLDMCSASLFFVSEMFFVLVEFFFCN